MRCLHLLRFTFTMLFLAQLLSGCGGCDDTASSSGADDNNLRDQMNVGLPQRCEDLDGDGFFAGLKCDENMRLDCNDSTAAVSPLAMESCEDAIDNNCDGEVNEGCVECEAGAVRPCSMDRGACSAGEQACVDGFWGSCSGVEPSPEQCDGIDNDCDGEVDEQGDSLCDDGLVCNGEEVCEQGACVDGTAPDCAPFDGACTQGVCDEKVGGCRARIEPDDSPCDDGNFCTIDGVCLDGVCLEQARDCSGEGDQCNEGVCDEDADACVASPIKEGEVCDDGLFCTASDTCQAGICSGGARDCSGEDDQCNVGVCDEASDSCVADPVADDTSCDDGAYCTTGEVCTSGACGGGVPRQCGASGGACRSGVCDEASDSCTGDPIPDGSACDDGLFCTTGEACVAGSCVGGAATSCAGVEDQCNGGMCDDALNRCVAVPVPNDTACDDGVFCTIDDACQAGVCSSGGVRACPGDQCNSGVCDATSDSCELAPLADGTGCDDGLFCTTSDACQAGSCEGGQARICTGNQCNSGVCDEANDSCELSPVTDGTSCDDSLFCTTSDACQAGSCEGGAARTCSGDQCNVGVCDEASGSCALAPIADGTSCDDSLFCTLNDSCQAGSCAGGVARPCSGDQCNSGVCDEASDSCDLAPLADGTSCDDNLFCTLNDACQAGSCEGGAARPCSGDQCNSGVCDEASDSCEIEPVVDGLACDDGLFCTVDEVCVSGFCEGLTPRTCAGNLCNVGVCDEGSDACTFAPLPDGTGCDDGLYCTSNDVCASGMCTGGGGTCENMMATACTTLTCDETLDACEEMPDPICCDVNVDADLDGANSCDDCDDGDGSIFPGAMERCDGLDNDCDGLIDEDFDVDGDGFGLCSTDPFVRDCDDAVATTYPGAPELCGAGAGDGVDNDCDGYVDEGCQGCSMADGDGDGFSDCDGDCNDSDPATYPGAPEACDGEDNDCNQYTRPNCGVSQPCNFDGDNDPSNEQDVCQDDMTCACALANSGNCTGDYLCTSFCNSSDTGGLGDGCEADQYCAYNFLYSANIHGCAVTTDPISPTPLRGGEPCGADSECRSLSCAKICNGQGCNQKYCQDWCASDDYCGANAVCRVRRTTTDIDGRCQPDTSPFLGASAVGDACTQDRDCDHGFCNTTPSDGQRRCSEACCQDADCPSGFTCSLEGDGISAGVIYAPPGASSCTTNADCVGEGDLCNAGECVWRIMETSPVCVPDVVGQGQRQAGQACSTNTQCASNFCDAALGVCIEVCCSDNDCPTGQSCEKQFVETLSSMASQVRICVNASSEEVFSRK